MRVVSGEGVSFEGVFSPQLYPGVYAETGCREDAPAKCQWDLPHPIQ